MYQNLDGVNGLAGWRWLYIICGVMTIPVGIVTFFFFPDTPHTTKAFFLTKEERDLGVQRAQQAGKAAPSALTLAKIAKVLTGWRKFIVLGASLYMTNFRYLGWWLLVLGYVVSTM